MDSASQTFRDAADLLTRGESHRVWSLIVTIFGDMAQGNGDAISGAALARLVGLMGIRPEAMRVALHRLRKDGWIDSRREGRGSLHWLTPFGRRRSAEASPRIYERVRRLPGTWHLLLSGGADGTGRARLEAAVLTGDYLPIGTQALLGQGPLPGDLHGLLGAEVSSFQVPGWLRDQVCPAEVVALYNGFEADLCAVADILDRGPPLGALETAAMRLLCVHSWRRLLFRHPDLPDAFFPDTWPGAACRTRFCDLIERLPAPGLDRLEAPA